MYDDLNNSIYSFLFDSIIICYLIEHCGLRPPTSLQIGLILHSSSNYFDFVGFPSVDEVGVLERGKDDVDIHPCLRGE